SSFLLLSFSIILPYLIVDLKLCNRTNNWVRNSEIPAPKEKKGHQNAWTPEQIEVIDNKIGQKNKLGGNLIPVDTKLCIKNRRYLGSKQKMLEFIDEIVSEKTNDVHSVADIFAGTGVVADLFNKQGKKVIVNDILTSNYISYQTWFGNESVDSKKIQEKVLELNNENGLSGYITENFGNKYFSLDNAKKIDAIREKIELYDDINNREKPGIQYLSSRLRTHIYSLLSFVG
ncbi:DNA adenine methylase, partial [Enterococcus faecium]|uniref:DNA adenine methylase n=1 Tax=Enterococcus faecium TaxID=1352 RepID=UPI003D7D052B